MPSRAKPRQRISDGQLLTGHVAEWAELLTALDDRSGLTVIVADPLSGASLLLASALKEARVSHLLVDARTCADARDLALLIADAAIESASPAALPWWQGFGPSAGAVALRIMRQLRDAGIETQALRAGKGPGGVLLSRALDLAATLAAAPVLLAIDHLGVMVANTRERAALEILDSLRAGWQRHPELGLLLVDHRDGHISQGLSDATHPLYRAGSRVVVTRPSAERMVQDLAITKPLVKVPIPMLRAAADLAAGVPALTWQVIDLAGHEGDPAARTVEGWQRLRHENATAVRQQWDALRRLHPAAQTLVSSISLGLPPHSAPAASKTVDDGLNRLRDVGLTWQPRPRTWAIADPLLASFAREHTPPWARRRTSSAQRRASRGATDTLGV